MSLHHLFKGDTSVERLYILLPVAWMGLIYGLSSIPGQLDPADPTIYRLLLWLSPAMQNVLHIPLYGALAWFCRRSLQVWLNWRLATVGTFVIAAGYAVYDEWHQSFVPGRYASVTDVLLDMVGVGIALWLFNLLLKAPE